MVPTRALTALAATALGLVLLLSFRTPEAELAGASPAGSAGGTGASSAGGATADAGTGGAAAGTTPSPAAAGGDTTAARGTVTVAGDAVAIRWGTVQVQVTVTDGVLTDVVALRMPSGDRHTQQLSQRAEPILRASALQAQSANVDTVSGATYTSLAYARSLQSALDAAGLAA